MNDRERFLGTMRYQSVDRRPLWLVEVWPDTLARWKKEGLPADIRDVHAYLGVKPLHLINVTGAAGIYPPFEQRTLKEDTDTIIGIDRYGRTVRRFKHHTSMPEWLDFPVKTATDLRRLMNEHFDVEHLDRRYPTEWRERFKNAQIAEDALIVHDGGCHYNILRNLAGLENASYLLYDAPELVNELFERNLTVVMYGLQRLAPLIRVDVLGYGEDIACKHGPLISLDMFRKLILPKYRKALEFAHTKGIEFTWYDSDGDVRMCVPDYLSVGINGFAPCEVAAGMDPVELRRSFGRELRMIGGFDKRIVASGKAAIDAEFARLRPVIEEGGYVPAIDHSVSSDISWDNYRYYLDTAQKTLAVG